MSLDGNGTYSPPAPQFPAIPNTIIYADDFNQIILDIATALSTAIFRDGQAAFTANQSMGNFKLINLANGVNPQDAVTVLQVFTNPTFNGTSADGVKVTGTKLTVTATTVQLPASTSIGGVSAAELAVLDGITSTTAELNILHGATVTAAQLNILNGATITTAELNQLAGVTSSVQGQLDAKAPINSPAFTGVPTAPTAATGASTTQLATTQFVMTTAFNAALPDQAENTGKFVTTDGTNASWAAVPSPDMLLLPIGVI